jgi:hypothetical protein
LEIDFDAKAFYDYVKRDLDDWQQEWKTVQRARGGWVDSAAYRFGARIVRAAASMLTLHYSRALRDIISAQAYDLEHWRQTINKKMNESIKGERKQIEDWYFSAALQGKWLDEERAAKEKALEQKYLSQEKELHNQYVTRYAQLIQEKVYPELSELEERLFRLRSLCGRLPAYTEVENTKKEIDEWLNAFKTLRDAIRQSRSYKEISNRIGELSVFIEPVAHAGEQWTTVRGDMGRVIYQRIQPAEFEDLNPLAYMAMPTRTQFVEEDPCGQLQALLGRIKKLKETEKEALDHANAVKSIIKRQTQYMPREAVENPEQWLKENPTITPQRVEVEGYVKDRKRLEEYQRTAEEAGQRATELEKEADLLRQKCAERWRAEVEKYYLLKTKVEAKKALLRLMNEGNELAKKHAENMRKGGLKIATTYWSLVLAGPLKGLAGWLGAVGTATQHPAVGVAGLSKNIGDIGVESKNARTVEEAIAINKRLIATLADFCNAWSDAETGWERLQYEDIKPGKTLRRKDVENQLQELQQQVKETLDKFRQTFPRDALSSDPFFKQVLSDMNEKNRGGKKVEEK